MHKFSVTYQDKITVNDGEACLYILWFGDYFYIHKGKYYEKGVEAVLKSVFSGIRGKYCQEMFKNIVELCLKYPALHKVEVEPQYAGEPKTVLRKEKSLLNSYKKDPKCLNNFELPQLTPDWMQRVIYGEKCDTCIKSATINKKRVKFNFCPACGRGLK